MNNLPFNEQNDDKNIFYYTEEFFQKHEKAAEVISRQELEKYFRLLIWDNKTNEQLQEIWPVMELLLLYIEERELVDVNQLNMYDYQLIIWRAAHGELGENVYLLTENNVKFFVETLHEFYTYLVNRTDIADESIIYNLDEFYDSVYLLGNFDFPEIDETDPFFEKILHFTEMDEEDTVDINAVLENLLNRIGEYYHSDNFSVDLARATVFFADPDITDEEKNSKEFWFSFWDFFMFDYHLMNSDLVPVFYYYKNEGHKLPACDKMILRDLIRAQFRIFEIVAVGDVFALCHDLILDEEFEIPVPSNIEKYENIIMLGHTHKSGPMLLNYLTQFEATPKLRNRIASDIKYMYEMYKCQKPKASITEFINRNNAAVRHLILIFSTRSQLGIFPHNDLPAPIKKRRRSIMNSESKKSIFKLWYNSGMSKNFIRVSWTLYLDAATADCFKNIDVEDIKVICAISVLMERINNMSMSNGNWFKLFRIKKTDVYPIMLNIVKKLGLITNDPRYMTEEGFVHSLYFESSSLI